MNREQMDRKLDLYPGIGVIATRPDGTSICYFYEDFDGPATGIRRAMKQLYPLHDKGVYKSLTFIERHKRR